MIVFLIFLIWFCISLFVSTRIADNIPKTDKISRPRAYSYAKFYVLFLALGIMLTAFRVGFFVAGVNELLPQEVVDRTTILFYLPDVLMYDVLMHSEVEPSSWETDPIFYFTIAICTFTFSAIVAAVANDWHDQTE